MSMTRWPNSTVVTLSPPIVWRVEEDDPSESPPLRFARGARILNPLRVDLFPLDALDVVVRRVTDGAWILRTGELGFVWSRERPDDYIDCINEVLRRARLASGQSLIQPKGIVAYVPRMEVRERKFCAKPATGLIGPGIARVSLRFASLGALDLIDPDEESMPVEVLVDAFAALEIHDYRRCIVFAAIAAEAGASARVEYLFEQKKKNQPDELNLVSLPAAGGRTTTLDPVFDMLWRKTSGNYMKRAVHEAMLYLDSRSLLVENEDLFRRLKVLGATRNQLVHFGVLNETRDRLSVDEAGAKEAIKTASELLIWLGYKLPPAPGPETEDFDAIAVPDD